MNNFYSLINSLKKLLMQEFYTSRVNFLFTVRTLAFHNNTAPNLKHRDLVNIKIRNLNLSIHLLNINVIPAEL